MIWGLHRLQADAFARAEIDKLITYLQNHRQRIDDDACKAEGLPIGSGAIESANKFISHARLKRSGAWWVVTNGNGMLRRPVVQSSARHYERHPWVGQCVLGNPSYGTRPESRV
ncbi:hypothetical protein TVNIR_2297 [Thioalkalivibrio nitratireducens DSM 14787]|uniref:Uncharacterized protein n=1 Tax=Thioalkalivibrio nitratireducens (strain DSM 14787 / UNIQEM 213 / ALEN2) TaxID=1255043 RepID=L0E005_THIND|nr:hypothetical protein TVNIR_2297 [Thioalkalivibrio nitratireducens DSM 14787]